MVAGFSQSPPNEFLLEVAEREHAARRRWLLDIGCGAGRNGVPLALAGWNVVGLDLSWPMLQAAARRAVSDDAAPAVRVALASMDALPVQSTRFDFVVAHGIWNLARSSEEFRRGVREAARVARPGGVLFVFTFSRNTLPADARPVPGEPFVFTQFSGQPQCFLTADQLIAELGEAGFAIDPGYPLNEHNLPRPGTLVAGRVPVIYEGVFRRVERGT
jgi:SAM-dependent methyltransferase